MKQFNQEKAEAGAELQTRSGLPVRILATDIEGRYPIAVAVSEMYGQSETLMAVTAQGRYIDDENDHDSDVFMAPVKKSGWINIYPDGESMIASIARTSSVYPTEEVALDLAR